MGKRTVGTIISNTNNTHGLSPSQRLFSLSFSSVMAAIMQTFLEAVNAFTKAFHGLWQFTCSLNSTAKRIIKYFLKPKGTKNNLSKTDIIYFNLRKLQEMIPAISYETFQEAEKRSNERRQES